MQKPKINLQQKFKISEYIKYKISNTGFKISIVAILVFLILVVYYIFSHIAPSLKSYDVVSEETYKITEISDQDFLNKVQNGTLDEVKQYLLLGANPNAVDENNHNALAIAALLRPDPKLAKLLINNHINVNYKDNNGYNALMLSAIAGGNNLAFTDELIKGKIDVNAKTNSQVSTLMVAVGSSTNVKLVEKIIRAGANVNYKNHEKVTALMVAAKITTNPKIIEVLLKHGANVAAKDSLGISVYEIARTNPALRHNRKLLNRLK